MSDKKPELKRELIEEELNMINGGGWWSSYKNYKSGKEPLFKVGETVFVRENDYICQTYITKGEVLEIQSKSSNVNSEYRYKVRLINERELDDVFESQMLAEFHGGYEKLTEFYK